jgi:hypothetical protein
LGVSIDYQCESGSAPCLKIEIFPLGISRPRK